MLISFEFFGRVEMSKVEATGFVVVNEDSLIVGWGQTIDEAAKSVRAEDKSPTLTSLAASLLLLSDIVSTGPDNVAWLTCEVDGVDVAINEYELS